MNKTTVCVVGAGPAGAILSYLLARNGIDVTLLEAQKDFDRDFRGDTLHYAVMENLDQMGLAERLLTEKPHYKLKQLSIGLEDNRVNLVDFSRLRTPFPFVTVMAQTDFLQFIADEASQYPHFHLRMHTRADDLIRKNGRICGVIYRSGKEKGEIEADLVVACDGRSSKLRRLVQLEPQPLSDPLDVLWFRLPRLANDPKLQLGGGFAGGRTPIVVIERTNHFQIGITVPHGKYRHIKREGLPALHQRLIDGIPAFADRVHLLDDWRKVAFLQVTDSRVKRWYRDGMLLLGDAAHVMSPVGGVGINYAIQDAIVAANVLVEPIKQGMVSDTHFAKIQKQRRFPTWLIQTFQAQVQKRIIDPSREDEQPFNFPWFVRWLPRIPIFRDVLSRLIGSGLSKVEVKVG